jgi:hypothetical protein
MSRFIPYLELARTVAPPGRDRLGSGCASTRGHLLLRGSDICIAENKRCDDLRCSNICAIEVQVLAGQTTFAKVTGITQGLHQHRSTTLVISGQRYGS